MTKVTTCEVSIVGRDGKPITTLALDADAKVIDLKKAFHAQKPKYSPSRQYYTIGTGPDRVILKNDQTPLSQFGIGPSSTNKVVFKDLGPQISWRTVFFVEYFGPILMHFLVWNLPGLFYSQPIKQRYPAQTIGFALVMIHYIKRELETAFVHRFSSATMPMFNIFKNSFHYWILGGLSIAYFLYHPLYTPFVSFQGAYACAAVFITAMLCNLYCHIILMNLRPAGSTVRAIPKGFAFEYVSCPNYFFEIVAWTAFAIMSGCLTAYIFLVVSAGQMLIWALGKHKAYRKEFPNYPRSRKALIPFIK